LASQKSLNNHLKSFQKEANALSKKLAEWKGDEHKVISLRAAKHRKRTFFYTTYRAFLLNIYHEQIIAYIHRIYRGQPRKELIFMKSTAYEWAFVLNQHGIMTYVNGKLYGVMLPGGEFVSPDGKNLIAKLDRNASVEYPLLMDNKVVAGIPQFIDEKATNPRAVYFYSKDLDEVEINVVVSIALINAVQLLDR
jgi:hypothetical protein